ncbi:MAG: tRNA dihydrouridine(20/20a) synthase DusA [Betaproteobacteria bacterium]|nr:tRNA dihydrouridine(20/20a) synthase DusA [Betaproteobacteria bacterium]MDH5220511.1 tRNA dihydrouridine(20/20a) synthase DusA [Betaproteobacteria bacterium]MDH5351375.1 tRNA dihydrouridine(20/20a) synthase DusA [Betaproteobacteria bacterium]
MTAHRLCVAPMMDWTDRHCRFYLRQISARAFLYTEMITTGALLHGDVERHLAFSREEHPVAAQLGGSEPQDLAHCARLVQEYGYDEVNLNCGCPSERVQKGAFGACLMAEPELVADCVRAMKERLSIPVTVKHRTGIDRGEAYDFLARFVDTVARAGCSTFIVHARNAVLKGLSPKENREIPPLKYEYVHRLKRDFPQLEIVSNGGITSRPQIDAQLAQVDGVMLGRAAYHDSWILADPGKSRAQVVQAMAEYAAHLPSLRYVARHMLGLYHGHPRARLWRRMLSDPARLSQNDPRLLLEALDAVESGPKEIPHERRPQAQEFQAGP